MSYKIEKQLADLTKKVEEMHNDLKAFLPKPKYEDYSYYPKIKGRVRAYHMKIGTFHGIKRSKIYDGLIQEGLKEDPKMPKIVYRIVGHIIRSMGYTGKIIKVKGKSERVWVKT